MKKKTILITGATSGIGLGCARKFAENGDRIILNGRNIEKLETIRQELEAKGTEVLVLAFDVRDREASEPEYEGDLDDWETMIDTNIKGLLTMTRLVVPQMIARNSGHIINIGSVAGDAASPISNQDW